IGRDALARVVLGLNHEIIGALVRCRVPEIIIAWVRRGRCLADRLVGCAIFRNPEDHLLDLSELRWVGEVKGNNQGGIVEVEVVLRRDGSRPEDGQQQTRPGQAWPKQLSQPAISTLRGHDFHYLSPTGAGRRSSVLL